MFEKIQIFVSYARKDNALRETFFSALKDKALDDIASLWWDESILPGRQFKDIIQSNLLGSEMILLLVTRAFLSSTYCMGLEAPAAVKQQQEGKAVVLVIPLEECELAGTPLAVLPCLPAAAPWLDLTDADRVNKAVLAVKNEAYCFVEDRYGAVTLPEGESAIFEPVECDLLMWHEIRGIAFASKHGAWTWAVGGAVGCALPAWWATSWFPSGIHGFLGVFALFGVLFALSDFWKLMFRNIELFVTQGSSPGVPGLEVLRFWLSMALPVWLMQTLMYGLPLTLLIYLVTGKINAWGIVVAALVIGALGAFSFYTNTRPKRLGVYQQLYEAGLTPKQGWRIDTLLPEYRTAQDTVDRRKHEWLRPKPKSKMDEMIEFIHADHQAPPDAGWVERWRAFWKRTAFSWSLWCHGWEDRRNDLKWQRESARKDWKEKALKASAPPPKLKCVVICAPEERHEWRLLRFWMKNEGLLDICELTYLETSAEGPVQIPEADAFIPVLSPHLPATAPALKALFDAPSAETNTFPVAVDGVDHANCDLQFLPDRGVPVRQWGHRHQGRRNVVRGLRKCLLPFFKVKAAEAGRSYGTRAYRYFQRHGNNFDLDRMTKWVAGHGICGLFLGVLAAGVAARSGTWAGVIFMAVLQSLVSVVFMWLHLRLTDDSDRDVGGRHRVFGLIITLAMERYARAGLISLAVNVPLAMMVFWPAQFLHPQGTNQLLGGLEKGLLFGLLAGAANYLAILTRGPKILLELSSPQQGDPLFRWKRHHLVIETERRAGSEASKLVLKRRSLVRFAVEIAIFAVLATAVYWQVLRRLDLRMSIGKSPPSLTVALVLLSLTLSVYDGLGHMWRRRKNNQPASSLRFQLFYFYKYGLRKICHELFSMLRLAGLYSIFLLVAFFVGRCLGNPLDAAGAPLFAVLVVMATVTALRRYKHALL